jgi:hypothetical protein
MNWPEACAEGRSFGPVAPDGHADRITCEAVFLEAPCPTFSMERCTGAGAQCPITFDPFIVIDDENQLHPRNVAAGCSTEYEKDEGGHVLKGSFWWATAHGKGHIRVENADGSVHGVSTFEIDQ